MSINSLQCSFLNAKPCSSKYIDIVQKPPLLFTMLKTSRRFVFPPDEIMKKALNITLIMLNEPFLVMNLDLYESNKEFVFISRFLNQCPWNLGFPIIDGLCSFLV
jgi:hypothetical protein